MQIIAILQRLRCGHGGRNYADERCYNGPVRRRYEMKMIGVLALVCAISISVLGSSLTAFIQPDERAPYFGVRGLHEAIYDGIEFSLEWEVGQFTFIEPRPLRDLPFYVLEFRPQVQLMFAHEWWFGMAIFNQMRTNHLGHYVFQPEFFIRHEW